jgi:hypothetical protein
MNLYLIKWGFEVDCERIIQKIAGSRSSEWDVVILNIMAMVVNLPFSVYFIVADWLLPKQ